MVERHSKLCKADSTDVMIVVKVTYRSCACTYIMEYVSIQIYR